MQYEEPTEEVEVMREKIELKRAMPLTWLQQMAASQADVSVAMNGTAGNQHPASLALGLEHIARAQRELHIPKQQVQQARIATTDSLSTSSPDKKYTDCFL